MVDELTRMSPHDDPDVAVVTEDGSTASTLDTMFHALQNSRRRHVVCALSEKPEWEVPRLADYVAAAEFDVSMDAVTRRQRRQIHVALFSSHLPKLDGAGVVEYDADRRRVRCVGDDFDACVAVLNVARGVVD